MKKHAAAALCAALLILLCSCAGKTGDAGSGTAAAAETETQAAVSGPSDYNFEMIDGSEPYTQAGVLRAFDSDGKMLWEYQTEDIEYSELETLQDIGRFGNGYVILADGELICIGSNGSPLWINRDFGGGSASFVIDGDTLYLTGYYGPELIAVDSIGRTVSRYASLDSDFYGAYSLTLEDGLLHICHDAGGALAVDPLTGSFSYIESEHLKIVSSADELMSVIGSDMTILLEPGSYDLSAWAEAHQSELNSFYDYSSFETEPGIYYRNEYDGSALALCGLDDLFIRSADPEQPAELVSQPRYAPVLSLSGCGTVVLKDLVMGHTPEQGVCDGSVLDLSGCSDVSVYSCDLYGCGSYGITADNCSWLSMDSCVIHDCSYGCAVLSNIENAWIYGTSFRSCREFTMFELQSASVCFYACSFQDLDGTMIWADSSSSAQFESCTFDISALDSLRSTEGYGSRIIVE